MSDTRMADLEGTLSADHRRARGTRMADLVKPATVRMRGDEWTLSAETAAFLEKRGVIWRDHDCEQNTADNGFPDAGPCYGVAGREDSLEETWNIGVLDRWADG